MHLSPSEFEQLRALVHRLCGLALTEDKAYLVRHRLGPVARAAGCTSFAAFLHKLASQEGVALREPIIEAITTRETSFFRDGHPFQTFRQVLLPQLGAMLRRRRAECRLAPARIWCAGVSTGQEAYSLAMLIDDYLRTEALGVLGARDFQVLATDVSARVLEAARAGRYSERDVARGVPPGWRQRYFRQVAQDWVIGPVRALTDFRRVNLMEDFAALGAVDVIFCRNVLIYFEEAARRRISEQFAALLAPGGVLVLGVIENLYGISTRFVSERIGSTIVYRRTEEGGGAQAAPAAGRPLL